MVVLLLVLLVGLNFVLTRTSFGRHVYAVGGNAEAARRAGINVQRIKLTCFVIVVDRWRPSPACCSPAATTPSRPTTGGAETLLYAVGAAVIGGTSLFGGKGKILDAVLGGLVIAVIINGMGLLRPAVQRRLHGDRRRPAHRGERRRPVAQAGRRHRPRLTAR